MNDCILCNWSGWVKTKIHNETLNKIYSENYFNTKYHLKNNILIPQSVTDCVLAIMKLPKESIGGRNISVQFDNWK